MKVTLDDLVYALSIVETIGICDPKGLDALAEIDLKTASKFINALNDNIKAREIHEEQMKEFRQKDGLE